MVPERIPEILSAKPLKNGVFVEFLRKNENRLLTVRGDPA
jgi:hypothetical protein